MALARSQSGPGGLSINTSSANSLFGSGTTPAAGMFGSTPASKPLFGAATTTAAPQTGGLFGSTTGTSGGLFGSTATTQPQAGGLFGATSSQPQAGGLFGAPATTSQPQTGGLFGSAAQPSGGLFGNTNTSQAAPAGGLFSNAGTSQNQNTGAGLFGNSGSQPVQSGGLFGNMNNQSQTKPATSLFGNLGNNQNQAQPQASSMFNQSQQQPTTQGFGGLSTGSVLGGGLGQANNQQQQTVPGVRIDTTNIRGTTRFNDLHEGLQQHIELCDKLILHSQDLKAQCEAIIPPHGDQLSSIPNDVEFCRRKLRGLNAAMSSDTNAIAKLQELVKVDIEHGQLSGRAIDNLRLPMQYHVSGVWPQKSTPPDNRGAEREGQDFVGYFSSAADELSATLAKNQKNLTDIELHLRSVEATSGQQIASLLSRKKGQSGSEDDAVRELAAALIEFEQGILNVAGKVGATREGVQTLQLGTFGNTNGASTNGKRNGIY